MVCIPLVAHEVLADGITILCSFLKSVLGTRFGSPELKIGSLQSEKIIIRSLESEKIGFLQVHTRYLTFSFNSLIYAY